MNKMERLHFAATGIAEQFVYGFCDVIYWLADKLEEFGHSIPVDEEVLANLPLKFTEKKRQTKKPVKGFLDCYTLKKIKLSEDKIKTDAVLDGFDEECLRSAKRRILNAARFIIKNDETKIEKNIAAQLAQMFQKGTLIITDTYLAGNEKIGAYFQPNQTTKKTSNSLPYIGLDIMTVINNDDAYLVNNLAHEAYHAWRFYTGNTEYSVIDETRAWNVSLHFSNKYRAMNGIPIERDNDYTMEELDEMGPEYKNAFNVNVRYGPGESLIEKIGYGIANLIEDAADSIDGWTNRIIEKTV